MTILIGWPLRAGACAVGNHLETRDVSGQTELQYFAHGLLGAIF